MELLCYAVYQAPSRSVRRTYRWNETLRHLWPSWCSKTREDDLVEHLAGMLGISSSTW
jgi:hypothetical protein